MAIAYADDETCAHPEQWVRMSCSVHVCRTVDDLSPLTQQWQQLEQVAKSTSIFTSPAWAEHVVRQCVDNAAIEAVIATVHRDGQLVALWPLARHKRGFLHVLTSIGAPFDQYSEALISQGEDARPLFDAMIAALKRDAGADGLVLRKAKLSSDLFGSLSDRAYVVDEGAEAPKITLDTTLPFADFLSQVKSKTRKNLRNYTNRLSCIGVLEHKVLEADEMAGLISQSFDARRSWLDDNGLSSEAFRDARFKPFVETLAEHGADLGLIGFALLVDEEPVALQWGFVHEGCYFAFLSARNPKFEDYSVGRIHLQHILETCHARGIGELDLMVPAAPYKMSWTKNTQHVVDLVWPWTSKGFLVLGLFERRLRPLAKKIALKLPPQLRTVIFHLGTH